MLRSERPFDAWNGSWTTAVRSRVGIDVSSWVLVTLLAAIAVAARRSSGRVPGADGPRLALVAALGAGAGLLASPYTWPHYHVLSVPLLLLAWSPAPTAGRARRIGGRCAAVFGFVQ